jgi:two-component system sensor histidine kinase/response regulator
VIAANSTPVLAEPDRKSQPLLVSTPATNIMVVDDQPANLKLMEDMLKQQGYRVRSFPRGRMALIAASEQPPDLILLDINMPEMNGFEVCERLKADTELASIPVIFLSALSETEDKLKAFQCGGVDYITKPFQFDEVHARVETHLSLAFLHHQLQLHTDHLEELVQSRTRELVDAQAHLKVLDKAKSDFLRLISHEFRTPLNGLFGIGEILLEELNSSPDTDDLGELFAQSRRRITSILDDAMLLTQLDVEQDKFTRGSIDLASIVNAAILDATGFAEAHQVKITTAGVGVDSVVGEQSLSARAIQTLLEAAVKFSSPGHLVLVSRQPAADGVCLMIQSSGRAIPDHALSRFFDLFSIAEAITVGGNDLGLGPPVASRILSLFGGSVTVENREPIGIQIQITFRQVGEVSKAYQPSP